MPGVIPPIQLAVALAAAALLAWDAWLARRGRDGHAHRVRSAALAALGVVGLAAYTNFGTLHQGRFLHIWDSYHYYLGAKYSRELGHERLYACTAVADVEAGLRRDVETRTITDLITNEQITTAAILAHPEACTAHFTAARWAEFGHDVAWFRDRIDRGTWRRTQRDHGYNATPVWTVLGHALADLAPASDLQLALIALIDPLLLAGAFVLLAVSFGWRVAAVAAVMLGTLFPARFFWTGGAMLRFDWMFCLIAGLCALRRGRPMLGGAALAGAALLRLFPAALLVGPAIAALAHRRATGGWDRGHRRLFAGAALTVALALPPALILTGDGGRGFVANTLKHAATPLTNHMGLPTLLSYRPDATVHALADASTHDLWPRFRQARQDAAGATRPVVLAAALAVLAALWAGATPRRRQPPRHALWQTSALSMLLIPVVLQLTCYYYVFVIAWATLAERRPATGAVLAGTCAASTAVAIGLGARLGMDELFVAESAALLLGLTTVVLGYCRARTCAARARLGPGACVGEPPDPGRIAPSSQPAAAAQRDELTTRPSQT